MRCAVIGAGMVGTALAAQLAEAGAMVTLLDKDAPGLATSRSSFAWLNSNDKHPRAYHELNHAGVRAWADLADRLDGADWYRPVGNLEWAPAEADGYELAERVRRLREWGYAAELIDADRAVELEPALRLAADVDTVAWFPDEGYLLPEPLVDSLVRHAVEHGAEVRTGPDGEVTGLPGGGVVVTAAGEPVEADLVICCAGRWTPDVVALAGDAGVPLVPWADRGDTAPGLVVFAGPVGARAPRRVLHGPTVHSRPDGATVLHLEALDAAVDLHTPDSELTRWADTLLDRARGDLSCLDDAQVLARRVCVRPMPVDGRSIIGPVPGVPGLYAVVTHSGVTLAALLARLVTAEILDGEPSPMLRPYRLDRFSANVTN